MISLAKSIVNRTFWNKNAVYLSLSLCKIGFYFSAHMCKKNDIVRKGKGSNLIIGKNTMMSYNLLRFKNIDVVALLQKNQLFPITTVISRLRMTSTRVHTFTKL